MVPLQGASALQLAGTRRVGLVGPRAELRLHFRSGFISPLYFLHFRSTGFCHFNDSFPTFERLNSYKNKAGR